MKYMDITFYPIIHSKAFFIKVTCSSHPSFTYSNQLVTPKRALSQ